MCRTPPAEVRIADPETGRGCPPDRIGEIWVTGDHVAAGYWRRPQATAATFQARCTDAPGRSYLRTGDLGLIVDGELYVVGRHKDMLVLRGRNHYPQDLEQTAAAAHPALRPGGCVAFAVPGAGGERPVIVQEVRGEPGPAAYPADVAASIRAAVVREHDLTPADLVLVRPGALPKTSSGKLMRAAARRRYLAGDFAPWAASTPRQAVTSPPAAPPAHCCRSAG
jgi:acyl-CoA synthetase (AMP-forming)/AMP-acid ligase II